MTNSAFKQIEVAEWEKEQRRQAIELLEKVKNNPIEKKKKPHRVNRYTIIYK